MRRLLCLFALSLGGMTSVAAQQTISPAEGNWGCTALIDNTKAGILTIFAGSYGYASANFGSTASGSGNAQLASDGVTFVDGNLTLVGVTVGLVSFDAEGNNTLTLYTPVKPILACTPR
ncbi:MAG: hypothetical protein ABIO40_11945 [Devosia sp.]